MTPDKKRTRKSKTPLSPSIVTPTPSSDDPHSPVFFRRHADDDPDESTPGREFLQKRCPPGVRAKFNAVIVAVAKAPPKRFSGGGYWEAMHGDMTGFFEIRLDGPQRHHYRLFCLLDYEAKNKGIGALLTIIDGRDKPFKTTLTDDDYAAVRALRDEYLSRNPRSLAIE